MISELANIKEIASAVAGRVELYSQLIAVEARIEKTRVLRRALWLGVGIVAALLTVLMIHVAVMAYFWDGSRMPAALTLLVIDAVLTAAGIYLSVGRQDHQPFAATTRELSADLAFLKESA